MYSNAIENMDFIKPHNKCPVIDHLNVYSTMNTPANTKYMYVQCNEYSLCRSSKMNTPSDDHTNLNCTMNTPSCVKQHNDKSKLQMYIII